MNNFFSGRQTFSCNFASDLKQYFLVSSTHFPLGRLALLVIVENSCLLGPLSHLQLALFHVLIVTVLLLDWDRKRMSHLFTDFVFLHLTHFLFNSAWRVIALLCGNLIALNTVLAIMSLQLATLKVDTVDAGSVFDHLLYNMTLRVLHPH